MDTNSRLWLSVLNQRVHRAYIFCTCLGQYLSLNPQNRHWKSIFEKAKLQGNSHAIYYTSSNRGNIRFFFVGSRCFISWGKANINQLTIPPLETVKPSQNLHGKHFFFTHYWPSPFDNSFYQSFRGSIDCKQSISGCAITCTHT